MNKRLCRKTHVGEFREWAVPIVVRRRHLDTFMTVDTTLLPYTTMAPTCEACPRTRRLIRPFIGVRLTRAHG
jgi:hypothetical protein